MQLCSLLNRLCRSNILPKVQMQLDDSIFRSAFEHSTAKRSISILQRGQRGAPKKSGGPWRAKNNKPRVPNICKLWWGSFFDTIFVFAFATQSVPEGERAAARRGWRAENISVSAHLQWTAIVVRSVQMSLGSGGLCVLNPAYI